MRSILIIILACSVFFLSATAQTASIDSLEKRLVPVRQDTQRVNTLRQLTWQLRDFDLKKALGYGKASLKLIEKLNYTKALAETHSFVGVIYRNMGDYAQALNHFYKALESAQKMDYTRDIAYAYNNIGEMLRHRQDIEGAKSNIRKAIRLFANLKDKRGEAYGYLRLGEAFQQQKSYNKALKAFFRAKRIRESTSRKDIEVVLRRIGVTYSLAGGHLPAMKYLQEALELNLKNNNVGSICKVKRDMARVHLRQKSYSDAIRLAEESLQCANQGRALLVTYRNAQILYEAHAAMENFESAFYYHHLFKQMSDSLFNQKTSQKIARIEAEYAFNKKEDSLKLMQNKERELFKAEQARQQANQQTTYLGLGLSLSLILILALFYMSQKRNNQLLAETNAQLVSLDEFKQQTLAMIVHDLKNPLNAIIGLAEVENNPLIAQSGRRMHDLVMNILDVQKMEEDELLIQTRKTALSDLITPALEQVGYLAQEKSITLKTALPANAWVNADKQLLVRVIVNLLINAMKYSPANSSIDIRAEEVAGFYKILVSDTGIGIATEYLDKIFDKYQQAAPKKSGRIRSTGLGLTFCRLAVQAHGGSIGVASTLGKGTTFWFKLPVVANEMAASPAEPSPVVVTEQTTAVNFDFTPAELQTLLPIVAQAKQHQIFEASNIRRIIQLLDDQPSLRLKNWKIELEDALFACNEERFKELLGVVNASEKVKS